MGDPRDNFETFFSPGGDDEPDVSRPETEPTPPDEPTIDVFGETQTGGQKSTAEEKSDRPMASAELGTVGQSLVELELITQAQWDEALARAGTTHRLSSVLDALGKMPSYRRSRFEPDLRAITPYQADRILKGEESGLRLGPYLFVDRLGAGGMGEVFKAWNTGLDRIEAVKLVTASNVSDSTIGMARFEREARVLAQLSHPSITTIFSTGRIDGLPYIAMEYIRGRTLQKVVREQKDRKEAIPIAWTLDVMKAVASALDHAHAAHVVHRDIKPNNIMITDDDEVRVLDMGIARLLDPESQQSTGGNLTRHVSGLGTPEVMPPEQWADASSVEPASDIYSLGCTFFYLLTGRMPFAGDSLHALMSAHLNQPAPAVTDLRPEVPKELSAVISRMLAKDLHDRYASGGELLAALEALPSFETMTTVKPRPPAPPAAKLPWLAMSAAAVVIGVIVAATSWYLNRPDLETVRNEWLTTFQTNNKDAWPLRKPLDAAILEGPFAKIESSADLDQFKVWLNDQSATMRRLRGEFYTWAEQQQAEHPDLWPSAADVMAFAQADLTTVHNEAGFQTVKNIVQDETGRRSAIHDKARGHSQEIAEQHPDLFPNPDDLHRQARESVPAETLIGEGGLEEHRQAVQNILRKRWDEQYQDLLATVAKDHPSVWKSVDSLREFSQRLTGDTSAGSPPPLESVRREVLAETYRRQARYWVDDFQKETPDVWKSTGALVDLVAESFPEDVEDEETYQRMIAVVHEATRTRVFEPTIKSSDNAQLDFQLGYLLRVAESLLALSNQADPPTGKVTLHAEIDGKRVESIPLETNAQFVLESDITGYVTLVVFESTGKLFLFQWDEAIKAGERRSLLKLDSVAPGTDRMLAFVTETNLREQLPKPKEDLQIGALPVKNPDFLNMLIIPPVQAEKKDLDRLRSALPAPELLDDLFVRIQKGKGPAYISPPAPSIRWGRGECLVPWGNAAPN